MGRDARLSALGTRRSSFGCPRAGRIQQRQARLATNLDEQHEVQKQIQKLEKQQRRQRQDIFQVEDSIIEKRNALIDSQEQRLSQKTESSQLFTISWEVM